MSNTAIVFPLVALVLAQPGSWSPFEASLLFIGMIVAVLVDLVRVSSDER